MKVKSLRLRAGLLILGVLPVIVPVTLPAQPDDEELAKHQDLARQAEARQDFAVAIQEYEFLVRAIPNNAELRSNLGVALYFHHDFKSAAEALRRAIALRPALYPPHLFLGMTMAHLGRTATAITELERAVSLNSDDPLARTWLGYEYTAESRFEEASRQFEAAARQNAQNQDVWFALGRCYLELGKSATAQLLQQAPDGARAYQLAAEQYEVQGNKAKALELYAGALERRPDLDELRKKVGASGGSISEPRAASGHENAQEDALYKQVEAFEQKARTAFEKIAQIDPDSYRAHQVLGDSAAAAGQFDDAIREYQATIRKKPDLPSVHGDLCNALARSAQIDAAIKECDEELTLSPYSSVAYVEAARVHLFANDDVTAAGDLNRALDLDRPPVGAYKLLAKIELNRKEYRAAIDALTRYTEVETKDASAFFLLARAYKAVGDLEKMNRALGEYKAASEFGKSVSEPLRTLNQRNDEDVPPDNNTSQESNLLH